MVKKETIEWVDDVFMQGDTRYIDPESSIILADFIEKKGIIFKEKSVASREPLDGEIFKIRGPQEHFKVWIKDFVQKEGLKITGYEQRFKGGIVDVMAKNPVTDEVIAIECCSCRITKAIDFLQEDNTSLWVLSRGDTGLVGENLPLFIFKRGPNWKECNAAYERYVRKLLIDIRSPLDRL